MKPGNTLLLFFLFVLILPISVFAQNPEIDVWYGKNQIFGHLGTPQNQIEIVGRISDPQGTGTITSFTYTLNGSSSRNINIGPDTRRLDREGDFTIEIFLTDTDLNTTGPFPTNNQIILTAVDEDTNTKVDTINFKFTGDVVWNAVYSVDWDTVTNIQNVVQVTDGNWEIVSFGSGEKGIRVDANEYAYDRAVILGEKTWKNYEVTVKVKINTGYPENGGTAAGAFFGFLPRWTGHTDSPGGASGFDPKAGWEPSGEFIGYSYENTFGNNFFRLGEIVQTAITPENTNPEYYKLRLQTEVNRNYYAFKHWEVGEVEPNIWTLEGFIDDTLDASEGSILLLAHNIDAIFGDITVIPLADLPVELTSFEAVASKNGTVNLKWVTATEQNNYGFEIERTPLNKLNWKTIGFINGNGNSNSTKFYSFTDSPEKSDSYLYRLKQIDIDGSFEYSKIVEIKSEVPADYLLAQNYPNPFNPTTQIEFSLGSESTINLTVYNSIGEVVRTLKNETLSAGQHNVTFNAENIASGTYIYVLSGSSVAEGNSFRLVKKMTVIK